MIKLAKEVLNKKISATAELIRKVEEESPDVYEDLKYLYPYTGNAYILGITGLPGSGKSTIINFLIKYFRSMNKSVGAIVVDPSSPLSNGSILGDRIRMLEHSMDDKVFIKSLATRGWYGGLSKTTARIINILDAMGKDVILLETVGVGQTEASIMNFSHTIVLVLVPEMGDYVQTIKAGVLEIGDIFVINKIDKRDPSEIIQNIESLIRYENPSPDKWKKIIIPTNALNYKGFDMLVDSINNHREYFLKFKRQDYLKNRARQEIRDEIYGYFIDFFIKKFDRAESFEKLVGDIAQKNADPYSSSRDILQNLKLNKELK
jgi:LAO/AO transport system kinase